jgi:hypothetical protein
MGSCSKTSTPDPAVQNHHIFGKIDKTAGPDAINEISDFSNVSGTVLSQFPKYEVPDMLGRLSKTSTPDVSLGNGVKLSSEEREKVTDLGTISEISDFSNLSGTVWSQLPKYGIPGMSGSLSKTSSPDVTVCGNGHTCQEIRRK